MDTLLNVLGEDVPGVTTPMLYWGMWKAMFAWHQEDMDLPATNFLHFGAPKAWYAVFPASTQRFKLLTEASFPSDAQHCSEFMRHKNYVISPTRCDENG
jgi:JmjC domain, hydroxylase